MPRLNWRALLERGRPAHLPETAPDTHLLLLDVDGVLVRPPDFYGAKLHREHPQVMRGFMQTAFRSASTGKSDLLDHLPKLMRHIGREGDPAAFYREWCEYENVPDIEMLRATAALRAQGWRVYLATNQERHRTRHLLEETGLGSLCDGHFASYAVGHRKPSADYYAAVTAALGVALDRIVFWDDAAENVQAARAAGWRACLFTGVAKFKRAMQVQDMQVQKS